MKHPVLGRCAPFRPESIRSYPSWDRYEGEREYKPRWYLDSGSWIAASVISGYALLVAQAFGYWGGQ